MSLLLVWGKDINRKRVQEDDAKRYCESVGAHFIRLRLRGSTELDVYGFQAAYFNIQQGSRGATIVFDPMKTQDGMADRKYAVHFSKDDLGIAWADVPDFEANINTLAACMFSGSDKQDKTGWEITDANDRKRVEEYMEKNKEKFGWKMKVKEEKAQRFTTVKEEKKPEPTPESISAKAAVAELGKNETAKVAEAVGPTNWQPKRKYTKRLNKAKDSDGHTDVGNAA